MPQFLQKRNGNLEPWNPEKIRVAIYKALKSTSEISANEMLSKMSYEILQDVNSSIEVETRFTEKILQEEVQDIVERSLMNNRYFIAAKNFIIFREKRREVREQKVAGEDSQKLIEEYIEREDWRVNENANIDYSFQGLTLALSGYQQATYCLNKFPKEIRDAHVEGYFHIHDLTFGLSGYCFSGDTKIQTEDFGIISFNELQNLNITKFKVASFKDGECVVRDAEFLGITREDAEVIEIEFEDGYKVKCTPDHKFLLKTGEYKEAQLLSEQDEIECLENLQQKNL